MESMGEEKSVLRLGGLAGVLAGVFLILGVIVLTLVPAEPESQLWSFSGSRILLIGIIDLLLAGFLLSIPSLGAIYSSLKEPSRVFARIGLGSGVLALVLFMVNLGGFFLAIDAFSGLYTAPFSDRPVVVATYEAVVILLQAGSFAGVLLVGLAFVAFGLAMRGSPDYGEGLAWLSIVLGLIVVLVAFSFSFLPLPVAAIALAVFAPVFGWKAYSLSRAA